MQPTKIRKHTIKFIRLLIWLFITFLCIFLITAISLQFSSVQTFLTGKITNWLSAQTESEIHVEKLAIRFPKSLGIKGIYIGDSTGDTLLYAGSLYVDLRMMALIRNKVNINTIELRDLTAYLKREKPDSVFNWQFIADNLAPEIKNEPGSDENFRKMQLLLNKVIFKNVKIHFEDHHSGVQFNTRFDLFRTRFNDSDLLTGKYYIGNTDLRGSKTEFFTYEPTFLPDNSETGMDEFDISVKSLSLEDFSFILKDHKENNVSIDANYLKTDPETISLHNRFFALNNISMKNLNAIINIPSSEEKADLFPVIDNAIPVNDKDQGFRFSEIIDWAFYIGNLDISDSYISIRQNDEPFCKNIFNPNNFFLEKVNISAKNIYAAPDSLNIDLNRVSLAVSENFDLDQLSLNMSLGSNSGIIKLGLQSARSNLGFSLETEANLLNFSLNDIMDKKVHLLLNESHIEEDVTFFMPNISLHFFELIKNESFRFGGSIRGSPEQITIDSIWINSNEQFKVFASGDIRGLPQKDSLYFDLDKFMLSALPYSLIPDSLIPGGIHLPEYIYAEGRFRGKPSEFETSIEIRSNVGDIDLMAVMTEEGDSKNSFEGKIYSPSLDAGHILQLGFLPLPLSFQLDFKGSGLDPGSMELESFLTISNLTVMEYPYNDVLIKMNLSESVGKMSAGYKDDFLSMELNTELGIMKETSWAGGTLTIGYADLKQLGLVEAGVFIGTTIEAELIFDLDDFFNGNIIVSNTNIAANNEIFNIPEILIESISKPGNYSILLSSGILDMEYTGNFSPADVQVALSEHFSNYISFADDNYLSDINSNKNFRLTIKIIPDELINSLLLPDIKKYDTLSASIYYNSSIPEFTLEAIVNDFKYAGVDFINLEAMLVSDTEKMDFGIYLDTISFNESNLCDFNLSGSFSDETFDFLFSLNDADFETLFYIKTVAERDEEFYHIRVDPEKFILNKENWAIHPENRIVAGKNSLLVSNFSLNNQESLISVNSREVETYDNVLDIIFKEINLSRFSSFLDDGVTLAGGILNGNLTIRDIYGDHSFVADLNIKDLYLISDTIGSVSLKVENLSPGHYSIFAIAEHDGTSLQTKGSYFSGEEPGIDMEVFMEKLNLSHIENFARGNITHLGGFITGNIKLVGKPDNPELTGELSFNETAFRVPALNAGYFLKKERITFDRHNIRLQNFTLEDSLGRRAQLNGNVNFSDFDNFIFNINLSTRNFLLMNLQERQGEMYHGYILMDSDLRLRGNHLNPSVEGRLRLNEGSAFTFILPQSAPEAIGDEGVVEFIQKGDSLFFQMVTERMDSDELTSSFERLSVNLNVQLDSKTELRVIIDDIGGDYLELKGGGDLSFGIDPVGKISMSGRYDIIEGAYLLTFYDVIRRNFRIQPGSHITWTGDPLEAQLDITAIYMLRTNAQELMRSNAGADQAQTARLRQQYPFLVYLRMKGDLMNPDISFELDMPPEHQSALDGAIMARINAINQNDSELNKQVFALLVLGSFLQENPLAYAGRAGIGSSARSSGSQILSQQLNRLSDRYIRGIDINFEVESYVDYSEGQPGGRTELQMEVSRNFFDERIRITLGGNIELEDETQRQTSPGDIAGDFSLEYLLTPEGTLIIKGFRNKDYGDLIEGDVTETGVSLIFSRSYNRFKELFRRKDEEPDLPEPEYTPIIDF